MQILSKKYLITFMAEKNQKSQNVIFFLKTVKVMSQNYTGFIYLKFSHLRYKKKQRSPLRTTF